MLDFYAPNAWPRGDERRQPPRGPKAFITASTRIACFCDSMPAAARFASSGPTSIRCGSCSASRWATSFWCSIRRGRKPIAQLYRHDVPVSRSEVQIAADAVLEIAIPWKSLAVSQDDPVHLYVELLQQEQPMERMPHEGNDRNRCSLPRLRIHDVASMIGMRA